MRRRKVRRTLGDVPQTMQALRKLERDLVMAMAAPCDHRMRLLNKAEVDWDHFRDLVFALPPADARRVVGRSTRTLKLRERVRKELDRRCFPHEYAGARRH